jgi:hypothetical protein
MLRSASVIAGSKRPRGRPVKEPDAKKLYEKQTQKKRISIEDKPRIDKVIIIKMCQYIHNSCKRCLTGFSKILP